MGTRRHGAAGSGASGARLSIEARIALRMYARGSAEIFAAVEASLTCGESVSGREIASRFGLAESSLRRHVFNFRESLAAAWVAENLDPRDLIARERRGRVRAPA